MPFPDPSGYDDERQWMSDCMRHALGEGREQDQAVAICLSMWRGKSEADPVAKAGWGLVAELKDAATQPRVPAGTPEGGQFASGEGGSSASDILGRVRGAVSGARRYLEESPSKPARAYRAFRSVDRYLEDTAYFEAGLVAVGAGLAVAGLVPSARSRIVNGMRGAVAGVAIAGMNRQAAQVIGGGSSAAQDLNRSASWGGIQKQDEPDEDEDDDDDEFEGWFVNDNGVLFAVVGDNYYEIDTDVPELEDLPPGDYTNETLAVAIAANADEEDDSEKRLDALLDRAAVDLGT